MNLSSKASSILSQITDNTKLGDLRKIAKEIKKDHQLAMELWATGSFLPRQLSILIMDNKELSQDDIDKLDKDIQTHSFDERNHLIDWLMANQLTKNKNIISLIKTWENSPSSLQRRVFWYYQGRLRWVGQVPPENTEYLLNTIENRIVTEAPEVQWAMNFTAGWIGVYDKKHRNRCVELGERIGLYKGKAVSKGCTPEYLPEFISIESTERNL